MKLSTFALAIVFSLGATFANAGEAKPFTPDAFASAQKAGDEIIVHIRASWCPTCHVQTPILHSLEDQEKFKKLVEFDVDFDAQKDVVRAFGARSQSTLIAFKGAKEMGRSVGDTDAASIADLLDTTL